MFGSSMSLEGGLCSPLRCLEREPGVPLGQWPAGLCTVNRGTFPALNVGIAPDAVQVYLFAPGIDPQSLDISIRQNVLSVAGERREPGDETVRQHRRERFTGPFRRVLVLPGDVDAERVTAHYRDGILRVTAPRRETAKPRRIEVR